ncbi:hypothetical protein TIFTF001_019792 [Ficus carica]|uniref:Uncharacterized protein n=1 Tax=Ficus carica TaxID=3494 RepID=A0AA88ADN6_FICCA|nr:hypothetical protein TIFTF001_019792 [Ficus carica]
MTLHADGGPEMQRGQHGLLTCKKTQNPPPPVRSKEIVSAALRGGGGVSVPLLPGPPYSPRGPHPLLSLRRIHALPRQARRAAARRRLARHRLRQHHRLLRPLRPRPRHGATLLSGLRRPTAEASLHHPPPVRHLPSPLVPPHFPPLAQRLQNPPLLKPGPHHHPHGPHLLALLPPRPRHQLLPPPNPHLPSRPGHHSPGNSSISRRNPPPPPGHSLLRLPAQARRSRSRGGFFFDESLRPDFATRIPLVVRVAARAGVDCAEPGVPEGVEAAAQAGGAELRVGLPGVVVVRDHDLAVRAAGGPEINGGLDGRADPNDVVDLRVPVVARVRGVDAGRERARGQPTREGEALGCRGGDDRILDGPMRDGLRVRDEREVGEDVHGGGGDPTADICRAANPRAVRARELPADGWVWGPQGEREAVHGSQRERERILSSWHARGGWAQLLGRGGLLWALAGPACCSGVLCWAYAVCCGDH